jgi:hypothetical protein
MRIIVTGTPGFVGRVPEAGSGLPVAVVGLARYEPGLHGCAKLSACSTMFRASSRSTGSLS